MNVSAMCASPRANECSYFLPDSPEIISLPVPKHLPVSTVLQVSGKFGSYAFEKTVPAMVKETDKKLVTIIQTDKPIYKAGELGKFKLKLFVDCSLKGH